MVGWQSQDLNSSLILKPERFLQCSADSWRWAVTENTEEQQGWDAEYEVGVNG